MRNLLTACFLLLSLLAAAAADGPDQASPSPAPAPGVTVEGAGTAKLPADTLEYRAVLNAGGATLADVMLEYDRATTRLSKALDQLGIKGLAYEMRGAMVSSVSDEQFRQRQQLAMRTGREAPAKCVVRDYVTIRASLDGLSAKDVRDLVIAILEVSAQVGLLDPTDNPQSYDMYGRPLPVELPKDWPAGMSFVLRDTNALYAAAVKAASDDARAKAEVQARVTGGNLGAIVGVETLSGGAVESGRSRDLQHRVVLRVRYELARK